MPALYLILTITGLLVAAVTIGVEGCEGRPVGALFVIGESSNVMEQSRPLSLNPFQGYSEDERNLAAGRYVNFDEKDVRVPLGLSARHMAAAGDSRDTDALGIVVSQTSGAVRVFRHGRAVLELAPRIRRG
jgi:diadenylate cyclase